MPINAEIKGQLAKLLATEDLIVENRRVQTAQFNVDTRVLTLPMWERASNVVYDLLVGHEVGHALFTPNVDPPEDIPHQFLNVAEDARIEKLMKRKYPGLAKTFFEGYRQLNEDDFFGIGEEDLSKLNIADRVNLYFKVGNFVDIPFSGAEEGIILEMLTNAETFADVILAAERMYQYAKSQQDDEQETQQVDILKGNTSGDGDTQSDIQSEFPQQEQTDEGEQSESDDTSGEQNTESEMEEPGEQSSPAEQSAPLDVKTAQNFDDATEDLSHPKTSYGEDPKYLEIPDVNLDTVIAKNSEIYEYADDFYAQFAERLKGEGLSFDPFERADNEYVKFKKNAQKEVSYLVKEFECKKSADSYARATTARTGVLDCTKLHTYKYNEDLFKKVSIIPDGKNHGLVFILDWSGSMADTLVDTIKQLYNLIWFCKKVNVPFDVYAFTNEWFRYSDYGEDVPQVVNQKENALYIDNQFRLMNLFTSKAKAKDLEHQLHTIWRIAYAVQNRYGVTYDIPHQMSLSGTPLNETVICLHKILPQFKAQNKVQKVQCVILTDGESGWLKYSKKIVNHKGIERFSTGSIRFDYAYLRDRKLGTTYHMESRGWGDLTEVLLRNLTDRFPEMNFVGIRLLGSRDINNFINRYTDDFTTSSQLRMSWKKDRSVSIKCSSYDVYFGLSAQSLAAENSFDVNEDASKAQIKRAFAKSLATKKLNKKVLSEFVQLIA